MRILVVTQQNSGVGYHRLMLPIYYLPKTYALFTDVLSEENLKDNYDILLINRFISGVELETILAYKEKYGFKLIVDIDDYWVLDSHHIIKNYPTETIIEHIKAADLVTTTHERLRDRILPFNKNVEILPNALPYGKDQFTDVRTESDKVRFVYAGSITHEKDVAILRNPLKRVLELKNQVEFCFCGYNPEEKYYANVWHNMIQAFTCGFKLGHIRAALPVTEYMNFYNDADCTIVPLIETTFNSMKSNLKLLEAACKKIPAIVSNVHPYKGAPILAVDKQTDWFKQIKKVTQDAIYRQEKGLELHEWAIQNFDLIKVNEKRKQLYASIKM